MSLSVDRQSREARLAHASKTTSFLKLAEGTVTVRTPKTSTAIACGSRSALTPGGEIVCTFMVQAAMGLNDFYPMMARSRDQSLTWQDELPLWPHLRERFSIFGSVSAARVGDLYFYGMRTPIDAVGESNWCDATQGLKANDIIWARSHDGGHSWTEPTVIPMPFAGAAEAPGAMCIASDGSWRACYSPYHTFDPDLVVPRNQVVLMTSGDEGKSWRSTAMLRFDDPLATAAEAWVVELADGRLLGTCWNLNQRDGSDYPNAYAISTDAGTSWCPTQSTGICGQASALAPLADGSVLFVYNQRRHGKVGVWLARALPTVDAFNVLSNEIIWEAPVASPENGHGEWTQFTFGEPSATVLNDGTILIVFWTLERGVGSIKYIKLAPRKEVPAPLGLQF